MKRRKKFLLVVGARPNFMKAMPLYRALKSKIELFDPVLLHTGQHYDYEMSRAFFEDLELPEPDIYLNVGSDTHARQTAKIMMGVEDVLMGGNYDLVIVFGDVNSTMASAIAASKLLVPTAHVEAGLRSFDRSMPEEINRMVTDVLSELLFVTEPSGLENLKNEGIPDEKIHFVGNLMIDTLNLYAGKARKSDVFERLAIEPEKYALLTLHRPSNVDDPRKFGEIWGAIMEISMRIPIIFPVHPRTMKRLKEFEMPVPDEIRLLPPMSYIDFLALEMNARLVLTDSGGIQEETTALGVQCITIRENTERPITVEVGTNHLVGTSPTAIKEAAFSILDGRVKEGRLPELWDGKAAGRIVKILENWG